MLGLMGSVAEFERSIIKERQAEGIAHAKARGVYKGRVKALTDVQVAQARQWICPKRRGAVELQLLADYIHGTPTYRGPPAPTPPGKSKTPSCVP